jgi:methylglutamate dehydrogenase subunit D
MVERAFTARSPFKDLEADTPGSGMPGIIAQDRDGLGLATVIARRGRLEALDRRIRERYGIELPRATVRAEAAQVSFVGLGPETWLACREQGCNDFAQSLRAELGLLASVSDQSDGYGVLRLSGFKVRETLAKLIPVDIHQRAFKPGDAASTVASHIGVTLWRLHDTPEGWSVFDIAVFRSLAGSLWHALAQSAAEFGLIVSQ